MITRSTSQSSGRGVTQQPSQTMGKKKIVTILLLSLVTGFHLRFQSGITKQFLFIHSHSFIFPSMEVIISTTLGDHVKPTLRKDGCGGDSGGGAASGGGATNSSLYWREIATGLAQLPVKQLLKRLEDDDPFGVRTFERKLIDLELRLSRTLTVEEIQQLFPCPRSCLLTSRLDTASLPAPTAFREGNGDGSWLLFQHLRKAGGTHFCSLARANLPETAIPSYFCMPDREWSKRHGAGKLKRYSNEQLMEYMKRDGYKIAANEYDRMPSRFLDIPGVVTATSFRKPIDRALSQFRFECIQGQDRRCKIKNVTEWWEEKRFTLSNVYATTFADQEETVQTYLTDDAPDHAQKRSELLGKALDVVQQLHLVLVMEWLSYAGPQVTPVLGYTKTSGLTKRLRPHTRRSAQTTNKLGAAGITEVSWDPKKYLTEEQYESMGELLALDMILNDAARRIFLERLVCNNGGAPAQQ